MAKENNATSVNAANTPLDVEFYPASAVAKEFGEVPKSKLEGFKTSLEMLRHNLPPTCDVKPLAALGHGVYELVQNGSPAWRCIFTTELPGKIVVLHVTHKTTNGVDRQIKNAVENRLKSLRSAVATAKKQAKQQAKKPKKS